MLQLQTHHKIILNTTTQLFGLAHFYCIWKHIRCIIFVHHQDKMSSHIAKCLLRYEEAVHAPIIKTAKVNYEKIC